MTSLEARNISISRAGSPILNFPEVTIRHHEKVLLLGPSGSGKTTLLSVLAGLLHPSTGNVLVDGQNFYDLSSRRRDRLRGQQFGFVFQTLHLLPSLTLRQNVALAADMAKVKLDNARLDGLLNRLGLTDKANRKPEALSQGEQQRAAIARAVLNRPKLIIADEPTSALDDANAQKVIEILEQQAQETGAALLIATHDNRIARHFETIIILNTQAHKEAA